MIKAEADSVIQGTEEDGIQATINRHVARLQKEKWGTDQEVVL